MLIRSCMWPALILCLLIVTGFRNDWDSVACHVAFSVVSVNEWETCRSCPGAAKNQEDVLRDLK